MDAITQGEEEKIIHVLLPLLSRALTHKQSSRRSVANVDTLANCCVTLTLVRMILMQRTALMLLSTCSIMHNTPAVHAHCLVASGLVTNTNKSLEALPIAKLTPTTLFALHPAAVPPNATATTAAPVTDLWKCCESSDKPYHKFRRVGQTDGLTWIPSS